MDNRHEACGQMALGRRLTSVLLLAGLVLSLSGAVGCQEISRKERQFGPPSMGGPSQGRSDAGEGVDDRATPDLELVQAEEGPVLGSFENPVRAEGPAGQLAYLQRLRSAAGEPVAFRREGTFRSPGGVLLDGFRLTDPETGMEQVVFLDLHHPGHRETRALPGYRLVPDEATVSRDGL